MSRILFFGFSRFLDVRVLQVRTPCNFSRSTFLWNFRGIFDLVYLVSWASGSVLMDFWDPRPHELVPAAHFCRTSGSARTSQFRTTATFLKCKKTQHTILSPRMHYVMHIAHDIIHAKCSLFIYQTSHSRGTYERRIRASDLRSTVERMIC